MKTLYLALVAVGLLLADDLKVISELAGPHVRYRSVAGKLTDQAFEAIASQFLGPQNITLGAIAVYGTLRDHVLAGPRGFDHCSYGHWRSVIDRFDPQQGCPEVKEATKIGSSIVIRSVDHGCRRSSRLLQGKAGPLDFVVAGTVIRVLGMSFSRPMGKSNERRVRVELYARSSGAVSVELAKGLIAQIRETTGVGEFGVELRSDQWFITDCGFPALFPFEDQPKAPSAE